MRAKAKTETRRALSRRLWRALGDDLEVLEHFVSLLESVNGGGK